jgi:DNA-binding NarL/FixJ family response regulator
VVEVKNGVKSKRKARNTRQDRIRVVIADDHAATLDKIDSLVKLHFDVIGRAENGRELVDAVGKLLPAVVTTDIGMPEMDGIGACRLITSQHTGVKVVVVSVYNDPTIVKAVFEAGASGYVWKPANHAELIPNRKCSCRPVVSFKQPDATIKQVPIIRE